MLAFFLISACTSSPTADTLVELDGSSTVYPISEAVAEQYQREHGGRVTVGVSGTSGGLKKFCRGELHITGASRPIRPDEAAACAAAGVGYIELPIATDGIVVAIHPQNTWAVAMTAAELKALWSPEAQGTMTRWQQVRSDWPDEEFHLFGPGVDSGTYDAFTSAVVGAAHTSRGDITSSEDDNVLVQGVARDPHALGFFGQAYYEASRDKLTAVQIDWGAGAVDPLGSRPLFLYVRESAAQDPAVAAFVDFYLGPQGRTLAAEVGYISLPTEAQELVRARFAARTVGTVFGIAAPGTVAERLEVAH